MPHVHLTPRPAFANLRAQRLQLPVRLAADRSGGKLTRERVRLGRRCRKGLGRFRPEN
jgi:hypothetical protein